MPRRGIANVTLIGHLGKEPSLRNTPAGTAVATFSVAVNRPARPGAGEPQPEPEWFTATAWGKLAETAAEYLTKGSFVYLDGRLQTRRWEDKAGQTRVSLEVVVRDLIMLGGGRPATAEGEAPPGDPADPPEAADDVPF
jgi:single-strand DNA-binding protein